MRRIDVTSDAFKKSWVQGQPAFRVDATSNFNDEAFAEHCILAYLTENAANSVAAILNEMVSENSTVFYRARPHDHKLWDGMAELI